MTGAFTHEELEWLHRSAIAAFHDAVSKQGLSILTADIAGIPIDIETAGEDLMLAIRPALSGIAVRRPKTNAARILVYDLEASGMPAPQFDRPIQNLIRWRGDCWTDPNTNLRVVFHMYDHTLQVFDPNTGVCVVIITSVNKLPPWSLAAPLRTPLSMILEPQGVYLVHGAAVGNAKGAALITGYGGSASLLQPYLATELECPFWGMITSLSVRR